MYKPLLFAFSFFVLQGVNAQVYNAGFVKPMDMPFNLAGSFGEPRPDHFHSGIDIKTNAQEGYPVFAIGDGYISRIKVSPYGYGKAIYISHPNGYTSVYAHLSEFNAEIEKYVHQQHYLKKTSELDIYPAASLFKLKQNDTIAFSGNTGGSSAPHLHFEIRDSKTEHALNPLDFYPKSFYVDTIPPQLNKVKLYRILDNFYDAQTEKIDLIKKDSFYTTEKIIEISSNTSFCFSLEGFDKQDNSPNKNGINRMELIQDGDTVFQYIIDEVDFSTTRMCNAFIDYDEMTRDSGYYYNAYKLMNNTAAIYSLSKQPFLKPNGDSSIIIINCYDYNNNKTQILLGVKRMMLPLQTKKYDKIIAFHTNYTTISHDPKYDRNVQHLDLEVFFPAESFFEKMDIVIYKSPSYYNDSVILGSGTYVFNSEILLPLIKAIKIQIAGLNKLNRNKVVIVRQNHENKETALKTTFDKTKFYAETKELGTFYLKYDTTKPLIQLEEIKDNKIIATITDELSGIQSYNGYIDGQWVNFYYDAKNDRITYTFDEYCKPGEHTLKLVVSDAKQNTNTITQKFKY